MPGAQKKSRRRTGGLVSTSDRNPTGRSEGFAVATQLARDRQRGVARTQMTFGEHSNLQMCNRHSNWSGARRRGIAAFSARLPQQVADTNPGFQSPTSAIRIRERWAKSGWTKSLECCRPAQGVGPSGAIDAVRCRRTASKTRHPAPQELRSPAYGSPAAHAQRVSTRQYRHTSKSPFRSSEPRVELPPRLSQHGTIFATTCQEVVSRQSAKAGNQ
jgi:hypothetical protein